VKSIPSSITLRSLLLIAALLVAGIAQARSEAWLDQPLSAWNQPSAPVPKAPAPKGDSPTDPRCVGGARQAATPEERMVTSAGWSLYARPTTRGAATVVLGEASVDGMCRPWDYQAFVFVKGSFAGTLSPSLMDSRTDGALSEIRFPSPTAIEIVFLRYVDADPLCCPSRLTTVRYRIERRPEGPVVVPVSALSKPTSR
jgi:LppP/LprE lipoprotein